MIYDLTPAWFAIEFCDILFAVQSEYQPGVMVMTFRTVTRSRWLSISGEADEKQCLSSRWPTPGEWWTSDDDDWPDDFQVRQRIWKITNQLMESIESHVKIPMEQWNIARCLTMEA